MDEATARRHARPMESAPRDGSMLRLLVRFEEHSTEDALVAWTIGANSFEANGEDHWHFAGCCWSHDHFTEGKGVPVGWLPMLDAAAPSATLPGVGNTSITFQDYMDLHEMYTELANKPRAGVRAMDGQ